jgi:hypothetical protein
MASTQVCVRLALSEVSLAKTVARGSLTVLRPIQASRLLPTFCISFTLLFLKPFHIYFKCY